MTERLLVLGLDAMEITLAERLMAEGRAPNLARLADTGTINRLGAPCMNTLPGSIWPEINTGIPAHQLGEYFHPAQIHTGEAGLRGVERESLDPERYYWTRAARAGKRIVLIDPIQAPPAPDVDGVQVLERCIHDQHWGPVTIPGSLEAELVALHGPPGGVHCSEYDRSDERYRSLLAVLVEQTDRKAALTVDLLERDEWDLASVTFTDAHCAGHQMWHLSDPTSPFHRADTPADLRDAVPTVYEAVDRAVGRVLAAAGADATVAVIFSHGMAQLIGGYQLLPPLLEALGMGRDKPALSTARQRVPSGVRTFLRDHVVPRRVIDWAQLDRHKLERRGVTAVAVPNNRVGAIRFNIRGREPGGELDPGDVAAVREVVENELRALVHPPTGELMVRSVQSPTELFGPDHHPDLPDLIVEFRRDLGMLDQCVGPTVGRIQASPQYKGRYRTGDHTDHSAVLLAGPGAAHIAPPATTVDVAPALLSVLGVQPVASRSE